MDKHTATLVIDAGNSETRVVTILGKNKNGVRRRLNVISNHYAAFDPTFNNSAGDPVTEFNSSIFHATGAVDGSEVDAKYVCGVLADREYSSRLLLPSGTVEKYKSLTTLLAIHQAFMSGYRAVSSMTSIPVEDLNLNWRVAVLMPPEDVEMGSREMASIIRSVKQIRFDMPSVVKDIEIVDRGITIMAEGLAGFLGVYFDKNGRRPEYEFLSTSTTLVMDIGAGTTDLMVVDNGSAIETTKYTIATGGNNVASELGHILKRSGYGRVSVGRSREAVISGYLQDGSKNIDVSKEVSTAKANVAAGLIGELKNFFESTGFEGRRIGYLMVLGGGAKKSENPSIEPISNYLVKEMKAISPNLDLVKMPVEADVDEQGDAINVEVNTRLLNVNGAAYQIALTTPVPSMV